MYCLQLAALLSYFSNGYNMVGFKKGRLNRFKILTEINVSDGLHRRLKLCFICTQANKRQHLIVVKLQIKPLFHFTCGFKL